MSEYIDYLVKCGSPQRKIYLLERKKKDGFKETVWCFQRHMFGWKFTGQTAYTSL